MRQTYCCHENCHKEAQAAGKADRVVLLSATSERKMYKLI
jgi:hypothetical protein